MKQIKKAIKDSIKPPASVFGAAPSLATMEDINRLGNKKSSFRGAKFWYFFRVNYPYVFPAIFLIFMVVALTGWKNVEGNLVLGSILSLFSSVSVVVSYVMIIPWRKHPSSLILYRSITSIVFSVNIILNAISVTSRSCRNYAVVTQIMLLAGEGWLTTIALDLVYSLTNPFTSYRDNLRGYHFKVWGFTGFISFIFFFDKSCQGSFEQGICWIDVKSPGSPCLWGYYLFWVLCLYLYNMWASIFAYIRLRKGLPLTFEIRKQCAVETFKCLMSYAIYLSLIMFFFLIISSEPNPRAESPMANLSRFLLFIIANRGSVDGVVWFMLHDFVRDEVQQSVMSPVATSDPLEGSRDDGDVEMIAGGRSRGSTTGSLDDAQDGKEKARKGLEDISKDLSKTITELADLAIAEFDEADLSPQVNLALRQQIVQYVTSGVRDAVKQSNFSKPQPGFLENLLGPTFASKDPAVVEGLPVTEFLLEGEHPFKAFAPEMFRELRQNEGIDDEFYLRVLSSTANERLSEGASGAFMFFCGGGEFIVKTIRGREARVLHASMRTYFEYLRQNKSSLLCRFLGSYSLAMYSQTFYFVVMRNCFDPSAFINERFDIKGSWVGRSADPVKPTKKVVCRHCNTYFVPNKREECTAVVGRHEASVVLKDNDLHVKISLKKTDAQRVAQILKQDSELLGQLGVLDYSLLIGVKKWKFAVSVSDDELGLVGSTPTVSGCGHERDSTYKAAYVVGPAVYYFGIVDFLQDWTFAKKVERTFKIYVLRKDAEGLSVNHPDPYMLRFQAKMDQIFDINDDDDGLVEGQVDMRSSLADRRDSQPAPYSAFADSGGVRDGAFARATTDTVADNDVLNPIFAAEQHANTMLKIQSKAQTTPPPGENRPTILGKAEQDSKGACKHGAPSGNMGQLGEVPLAPSARTGAIVLDFDD